MPQTSEFLKHICDGRVALYRLNGNPMVYARGRIQGKLLRFRTKQKSINLAEEAARDWWDELRAKDRRKEQIHARPFSAVADEFIEYARTKLKVKGTVSDGQIDNYVDKWNLLKPRFEGVLVTQVTEDFMDTLRDARWKEQTQFKRNVTPATLKKDIDFIRIVLKFAVKQSYLDALPEFPKFEGIRYKIAKRPQKALSDGDYFDLVRALTRRANEPTDNTRTKRQREQLRAFVMLSVCAGLRPSEAYSLRWVDCKEMKLNKKPVIEVWVQGKHFRWTGKREAGYAVFNGPEAFRRLRKVYPDAKPDDLLFDEKHKDGVASALDALKLRVVTDSGFAHVRTSKCFRPTGISMWIAHHKNVSLNDLRKVFRTSIEEIENFHDQTPVRTAAARATAD